MWKSAASVLDHMSGCLCPCLHICVGWWWGNLSLTGTRCTSAAGRRQVNSAELDSHLWPGFPEVASGCCLAHICDRTFHIMENADEESNWRTVRDLFHLVGCSNHQCYHVPTWCLQWLVNCTLKLKEHTWFWSFKVEAVLVGEFEWPSALRFHGWDVCEIVAISGLLFNGSPQFYNASLIVVVSGRLKSEELNLERMTPPR